MILQPFDLLIFMFNRAFRPTKDVFSVYRSDSNGMFNLLTLLKVCLYIFQIGIR